MVETVRILLGEGRHPPAIEVSRLEDFKKQAIVKKLDTFVARQVNEAELKKTEAEKDKIHLANRALQKELQSKLLRMHQRLSTELTSNNANSWQRRTWKENCAEAATKSATWARELALIKEQNTKICDEVDRLSKLGTRKIEKAVGKIETRTRDLQSAEELAADVDSVRREERKLAKKTKKVLAKVENDYTEKLEALRTRQRARIEAEFGVGADNNNCCTII